MRECLPAMTLRRPKHLLTLLSAALFGIALLFFLAKTLLPLLGTTTHGFTAYYTASALLVQRQLGPQAYDITWFSQQVAAKIGQPVAEVMTYNLPTFALLTTPLLVFDPQTARDVWMWLNLGLLLTSVALMVAGFYARQGIIHLSFWFLLAGASLLFLPVLANFHVGQAYIFVLFLFTVTWWGLMTGRDWLVGLSLGLAFILKSSGLPLWLLFVACRRWRALGWGVGTVAVVALFSLPWVGVDIWLAYPKATWQATNGPYVTVTAYQTTYSFLSHLFHGYPQINPDPLVHAPWLKRVLNPLITLVSLGVTLRYGRKAGPTTFFAALMCLTVILAPVAEEHNFALLLIPIAVVGHQLLYRPRKLAGWPVDWVLFGLGCLLLAAPIPYKSQWINSGWLALLAYPRLYGGWCLWGAAIWQMRIDQAEYSLQPGS